MTSFSRGPSHSRGSWDSWDTLLAHRPWKTNLAIAGWSWDPCRAWGPTFSHSSNPFVSFFSLRAGLTSHSRDSLPPFSPNLSWHSWGARGPRAPTSSIFTRGSWSSWLGSHFYRELQPGGVICHPLIKHFVQLLSDEPPDLIIIDGIPHHPRQPWVPGTPCRTGRAWLTSLPSRATWSNGAH